MATRVPALIQPVDPRVAAQRPTGCCSASANLKYKGRVKTGRSCEGLESLQISFIIFTAYRPRISPGPLPSREVLLTSFNYISFITVFYLSQEPRIYSSSHIWYKIGFVRLGQLQWSKNGPVSTVISSIPKFNPTIKAIGLHAHDLNYV